MTLLNIITRSLVELGRTTDEQSISAWREKLTIFANDGIDDLAEHIDARRTDKIEAENGAFLLSKLPRSCLKIVSVKKNGSDIEFTLAANSKEVQVDAEGEIEVEYRFSPKELQNDTDVPDIPEHLHKLVVSYCVYREHMTADPTMQRRSDAFYRLYEEGKRKARKNRGETDAFALINTGW